MRPVLPPTGLAAPEPVVASRAVRRGPKHLSVDFARLPGAGIPRLLKLLGENPQPINAFRTSWGDLHWGTGASPETASGALFLTGEGGEGYGAPPSAPRIVVLDLAHPDVVEGMALGLSEWLDWGWSPASGAWADTDVYVADSRSPRRRALRLQLPHAVTYGEDGDLDNGDVDKDMLVAWVAQARAGDRGDLVHPWPELATSSRIMRALAADPAPPGWRVMYGAAGSTAMAQLAAETHPLRSWSRGRTHDAHSRPAGVVLDGYVVETYTTGSPLAPDGIGITLAPLGAPRPDSAFTQLLGYLPPAHALEGRSDAVVTLLVESYAHLREGGVDPDEAAAAVAAAVS